MTAEDLRVSFSDLGVDVDEESLEECVRICEERCVEADTLVEAWVAFSLSSLGGAAPTVDKIRQLERKEFCDTTTLQATSVQTQRRPMVYCDKSHIEDTSIISNYVTSTTPKRVKQESTQRIDISPSTLSPKVSESAKYASRKNPGSIVLSYGDEAALRNMDKPCDDNIGDVQVTQIPNEEGIVYGNKAMFGYDLLHDMASAFDNQTRYLSQCILNKIGVKETSSVRCKSQSEVYVCGRVECDADARLNAQSVLLQGTWQESLGQSVPLSLQQCPQYALFPGQTVVVRGTNPRGDRFHVQEVFSDATLPLPQHTPDPTRTLAGSLTMLVASGPYTPSDSMKYEPLKDFVSYVCTHKPHIVIMTGPFLDVEHIMVKTPNLMAETYKSFFEKLLDNITEISVASPHTKVLIVSSLRDAFHQNIYPTPAYRVRKSHPSLHFLPDPCTLDLGGVTVGVTSTDVLMHLSQEEISLGGSEDKLTRLSRHAVAQQGYYPLWPPQPPCDTALWTAHAHLPRTPHLLILPASFRYFAKEVSGCVVVNPEHLTKGTGGGTFAKIRVNLDSAEDPNSNRIACQIIRI